jgi:hypothetical protein
MVRDHVLLVGDDVHAISRVIATRVAPSRKIENALNLFS